MQNTVLNYTDQKSTNFNKIPFWLIKLVRFEFWPFWILYIPLAFYFLWLAFKAKSFTFFTAANPGIYLGGLIGESKREILEKIDKQYLPLTCYFKSIDTLEKVIDTLEKNNLNYPIIIKPDIGERGNGVEKINTINELKTYFKSLRQVDFIIQEFIAEPIELGILYYKMPLSKETGITSIVMKDFLSVIGNGIETLEQLICKNTRAQLNLSYLLKKFANNLNEIIPAGKHFMLEPIGNHCRGTLFLNGNKYINSNLLEVFDGICKNIDGFNIGRFDIKVNSIEELLIGKTIKIMELNGISSEPAHIYDPNCTLWSAYRALMQHFSLVYQIAVQNNKKGIAYAPGYEVIKAIRFNMNKPKF